jgi:hypothetical protein
MENHEALKVAIAGESREHAKRLGLSTISVNKWQEPHVDFSDSGSYNPLDRIDTIVNTALDLKIPKEKALMPIYQLNHNHNLVCFAVPPGGTHPVNQALISVIKEFADTVQAVSEALGDDRIDRIEAKKIENEGNEALRAIGILIHSVRAAVR